MTQIRHPFLFILLILSLFLSFDQFQAAKKGEIKKPDFDPFSSLKARNIGPAIMGGRVVDFAVVESDTNIIYAAVGPSGVWKSANRGISWQPAFTTEATVAVGAVAVSQSHPDIVWVGTGEATARNSVGIGDGVYKSEDGGKTWKNMGLKDTRHISRIVVDRSDPDTVYIAAQGHLWGPNRERGVFKTSDGGKTWQQVLYINDDTGIADMAADPANNKIIYAAAWEHRRKPFHFTSGGEGSGLYKTTDGGDSWKRLTKGLPSGHLGRIGVDVHRNNPNIVYAVVEAKNAGVFRSDDKGESWRRATDHMTYDRVNFRPFYYSRITVDPNNDQVIYVYSGGSYVSRDGGKTYRSISGPTHPDHHALWVNPHDSRHIMDGNDGGIDISYDSGKTWHGVRTNAWSEVYQVGYDMRDPYYAYVGLQDNGSWGCPVNTLDPGGILNFHWYPIGGGDGFYTQVDPTDYSTLYRNAHMGGITRFDVDSGDSQSIKPVSKLSDPPYRFNWNAPILMSPHDPNVIYFGGNFLFKTSDRGNSWQRISPDLSGNDPEKQKDSGGITADNTGAEIHCTIYTLAESPVKQGVLWAGTDDGLVWVSQNGGKQWQNVGKQIKNLPPDSWVTRVEASHFKEGRAYVTFDRHRMDDYAPYIYRTDDFGKSWISLRANLPDIGYLHVVREGLENPELLFAGSEFGLHITLNGGKYWLAYNNDFPTVAVRDIQIHPREKDLLIGTHGRGLWVIDDITPLEKITKQVIAGDAELFPVKTATLYSFKSSSMYSGPADFSAPNPPNGAMISYFLKEDRAGGGKLNLTIQNASGETIRKLRAPTKKGFNRVLWDLRALSSSEESETPPAAGRGRFRRGGRGSYVIPGEYLVVLTLNQKTFETPVKVQPYEKHTFSREDREANRKLVQQIGHYVRTGSSLIRDLNSFSDKMANLKKGIRAKKIDHDVLKKLIEAIDGKIAKLQKQYSYSVAGATGYKRPVMVALRGGTLPEQISRLSGEVSRYQGKPTQTQISRFKEIKGVIDKLLVVFNGIKTDDVPKINRILQDMNFPYIDL